MGKLSAELITPITERVAKFNLVWEAPKLIVRPLPLPAPLLPLAPDSSLDAILEAHALPPGESQVLPLGFFPLLLRVWDGIASEELGSDGLVAVHHRYGEEREVATVNDAPSDALCAHLLVWLAEMVLWDGTSKNPEHHRAICAAAGVIV